MERRGKGLRWLTVVAAASAALLLQPMPIARTAAVPILQPVSSAVARATALDAPTIGIKRRRLVAVNLYPLPTPGTNARAFEDDLELELFPDVTVRAVFERFDTIDGSGTWVGHVEGIPMSAVTLAYREGALVGHINTRTSTFEIRPVPSDGDGAGSGVRLHVVAEVDHSRLPEGPDTEQVPLTASGYAQRVPTAADGADVIDVMVLYDPGSVAYAGGDAAIRNLIALGVADTNSAYASSGITQRIRLVHAAFIDYTGPTQSTTDLNNLVAGAGAYGRVAGLRDQYGADLVMLVYQHSTDVCGRAPLSTDGNSGNAAFGYSVVWAPCIPNGTFAHELGHNMGALHDWFPAGSDAAFAWPMPFARGYVNAAQRWRTTMAYNDLCTVQGFDCPRLRYFSNPEVEDVPFCTGTSFNCDLLRLWLYPRAYVGVSSGTNTSCRAGVIPSIPCDADNRRTLNRTASIVANYRQSRF